MDEKLKRCPFCGGESAIVRETHIPTTPIKAMFEGKGFMAVQPKINDGWLMECKQCGARGPHEYTQPIQSKEQAISAWNRRVEG